MTERGRDSLVRDARHLAIGPSGARLEGGSLLIDIDERGAPWPRRVRGRVRLRPTLRIERSFVLDAAGRHRWWPVAPAARVEVELERPALRWSGDGYLDTNWGEAPLEDDFGEWSWSRAHQEDATLVFYDCRPRIGPPRGLALRFSNEDRCETLLAPPVCELPRSAWRVPRRTRADAGQGAVLREVLEDGPFYNRSVLEARVQGREAIAVHEHLSLDRFRARWVQYLLPFRMPRALRTRQPFEAL